MTHAPKLVLMTPDELDILIQNSVRQALNGYSSKSSSNDDEPITIEEASEFLHIPIATIYTYTSKRSIPFHKVGKGLLFFKTELLAWIEEGKRKTKKEIEAEGLKRMGGARK